MTPRPEQLPVAFPPRHDGAGRNLNLTQRNSCPPRARPLSPSSRIRKQNHEFAGAKFFLLCFQGFENVPKIWLRREKPFAANGKQESFRDAHTLIHRNGEFIRPCTPQMAGLAPDATHEQAAL
ncbi:hypothetical protein [Albimonas pacifica]|uniref:hypothetical protein n=1 Tax=Albimonas pacifica TaxID=1114924 RepID=UPI001160DFE7|nr:hypothetical protein [Albimonas pacifica]